MTTASTPPSQLAALLSRLPANTPLVFEEDTVWTVANMQAAVLALAETLSASGLQPGDRVGLMFQNQKEFFPALLATRQLGAIAVPINITMAPEDIAFVLHHAGCRLVLCDAVFSEKLAGLKMPAWVLTGSTCIDTPALLPPSTVTAIPDALAILMYTSGTTAKPKGVMLSEKNILENISDFGERLQFQPDDKVLLALPLFHAYGLIVALYSLSVGVPLVLVPGIAPKKIVEALLKHQVSVLPLVPTFYSLLLKAVSMMTAPSKPFPTLRLCVSGGASLPPALLQQVEATLGVTVIEGYGLTEASPVVAVNCPKRGSIPGAVGQPLCNVRVSLRDEDGKVVSASETSIDATGEIWVQGENVMLGYFCDVDATREVLTEDGWLKTGDMGHIDADGILYISGGRKKELIIKAGENLSPLKIEQVLYHHPAVAEACVIGMPDETLGEAILACVQLKETTENENKYAEPVTEQAIKQFCRQSLPAFMVPDAVRFYEALPKNATGKILKKVLKEQLQTSLVEC